MSTSRAIHHDLVGEHRAIVGIVAVHEIVFVETLGIGGAVIRPLELHLAGGGRTVELDRILVVEFEVDEVGRVEDFKCRLLRLERRLYRQGEMQRQLAVLVFEEIIDRLDKLLLLAVGSGEGEEVKLLQRSTLVCASGASSSRV